MLTNGDYYCRTTYTYIRVCTAVYQVAFNILIDTGIKGGEYYTAAVEKYARTHTLLVEIGRRVLQKWLFAVERIGMHVHCYNPAVAVYELLKFQHHVEW